MHTAGNTGYDSVRHFGMCLKHFEAVGLKHVLKCITEEGLGSGKEKKELQTFQICGQAV